VVPKNAVYATRIQSPCDGMIGCLASTVKSAAELPASPESIPVVGKPRIRFRRGCSFGLKHEVGSANSDDRGGNGLFRAALEKPNRPQYLE
jgi:hypothetical protein